jgi:hypothetical protein
MNECGEGDVVFGWKKQLLSGLLLVQVWGRCSQGETLPARAKIHGRTPAKIMGHNIYILTVHPSIAANRLYPVSCIPATSSACPASLLALAWCTSPHCRCSVCLLKAVGKLRLTSSGPL